MKKLAMLFLAAAIGVSASMAQESATKPATDGKDGLKSVSCAPECGFMVRSHDEKELTAIVIEHAKTAHKKTLTAKDVKGMMKAEAAMPAKPEVKKY